MDEGAGVVPVYAFNENQVNIQYVCGSHLKHFNPGSELTTIVVDL